MIIKKYIIHSISFLVLARSFYFFPPLTETMLSLFLKLLYLINSILKLFYLKSIALMLVPRTCIGTGTQSE